MKTTRVIACCAAALCIAAQPALGQNSRWDELAAQPFPSISTFDKPVVSSDGSTDIHFGPTAPRGHEKNWLRAVRGKRFFVMSRLYGPTQPYYD